MRKTITTLAALVLALGFTVIGAKASASGSIGCSGGNGASTPCTGLGLGTVTQSGSLFSTAGIDVALTSVTGIAEPFASLEVFTPNTDQFNFSFTNVGESAGGTFSFTDLTESGALTVKGTAVWVSPAPTGLTGTLDLDLVATTYSFNDEGYSFSGSIHDSGSASLNLDPGTVESMTGSVGLPSGSSGGSGPSPTPEPGTLLLLASGLSLVGFIGRKWVVCG